MNDDPEEQNLEPNQEHRLVKAARIDANGIYQGIETLAENDLTTLHLPDISQCDLPIGGYQWDFGERTFIPIKQGAKDIPPDALNAIALGLVALLKQTKTPCPPETLAWLKSHVSSFDFKGQ